MLLLAATLILPGVALAPLLARQGAIVVVVPAALSMLAFALYGFGKRRATRGGERVPEALLLALDALGGWPGGLLAQQLFRHKTAKLRYQTAFWFIVAAYQGAAVWWLLG